MNDIFYISTSISPLFVDAFTPHFSSLGFEQLYIAHAREKDTGLAYVHACQASTREAHGKAARDKTVVLIVYIRHEKLHTKSMLYEHSTVRWTVTQSML